MRALRASGEGTKRMLRAPGLILTIWAVNLIIAAPLGLVLLESIHAFTKSSAYHQKLLEGFDTGWYEEFSSSLSGPIESFSPGQVGIGAWLDNLDRWWDGEVFLEQPALLATAAAFVLVWLFLLGGVLEGLREGAPRPRLSTVLADGAGRFPVFLRLALLTGVGYYFVFRLARWLFPKIHIATADLTVERDVLLYNLAGAALVVALVVAVRMVADYAKIAIVVERRSSAFIAAMRGVRFVVANPVRVAGIAGLYGAVMLGLFLVYAQLAPGAAESTRFAILAAVAVSQFFLVAKLALRVAFLGSEMAFFEVSS